MTRVEFGLRTPWRRTAVACSVVLAGAAVVTLAGSAATDAAAGQGNAARIETVTPASAARGAEVELRGGGFGAQNVRVWVGGIPADVLSATGSHVRFRVPAAAPSGPTSVEAANPGGARALAPFTVQFDGTVTAEVDDAASVTAPIGPEGGVIEAAGMRLEIPAGAIPDAETITLSPLTALGGAPFDAPPVGVKMEPSGLVLLQPATLTVPRPGGAGQIVGFGFNGDGEGFHLLPHTAGAGTVALRVWHFSGAGATTVSASELQAVLGYLPTPAHELAEQRIAGALAGEATGGPPPGQAIFDALVAWRTTSVTRGLDLAWTEARLDFFELAFGEWLAWRSYAQEYLDLFDAGQRSFVATATGIDRATATEAAAAVARVLLPRCTGPTVPLAALRDVIRLASAVNLDSLPTNEHGAEDGSGRNLPDGRNLATACVDVQLLGVQHPAALARNRDNRFLARGHVSFWKGDPSGTVPLRYRLADVTEAPSALASGTSSNGTFEATVDPGTLGLRRLEVTVDLDASGTDTVLRTFFDQTTVSVPVRERLELQALTPTTISAGGTVSLRVRVAGNGMVGAAVPLTVGGPGAVTPPTLTTDAQGEANAVYSVPADTMVTDARVDAALADGTSASVPITINTPVGVTLSPTTATLGAGQSLDLTATVTGTFLTSVTWTATGGEVVSTGAGTARYVAGTTPGTFSVTATSVASPAVSASATITIAAAGGGQVVGISRRSSLSASAFAVATGVGDGDSGDSADLGAYGAGVDAAVHQVISTDYDVPWFEQGSAVANQASTVLATASGTTLLSVDYLGSVQATASASAPSVGWAHGSAGGRSTLTVRFEVTGAPVRFAVDGGTAIGGTGCVDIKLQHESFARPFDADGCGDEVVPPISASGSLAPGRYVFAAEVTASGNQHTDFGGEASGNSTGSVTLLITQ